MHAVGDDAAGAHVELEVELRLEACRCSSPRGVRAACATALVAGRARAFVSSREVELEPEISVVAEDVRIGAVCPRRNDGSSAPGVGRLAVGGLRDQVGLSSATTTSFQRVARVTPALGERTPPPARCSCATVPHDREATEGARVSGLSRTSESSEPESAFAGFPGEPRCPGWRVAPAAGAVCVERSLGHAGQQQDARQGAPEPWPRGATRRGGIPSALHSSPLIDVSRHNYPGEQGSYPVVKLLTVATFCANTWDRCFFALNAP